MLQKRKNNLTGKLGEDYACSILEDLGYKVIEKNFRSKFGELDIITIKNKVLTFIEVKTRSSAKFGKPEEAVNSKKLEKIRKTIDYYCLLNEIKGKRLALEVFSLDLSDTKPKHKIIKVINL